MHQKLSLLSPTYSWPFVQLGEGGGGGVVRRRTGIGLLLLPLISCFRLFPLDHAAAHDAVETPQVEEGDGPK